MGLVWKIMETTDDTCVYRKKLPEAQRKELVYQPSVLNASQVPAIF